ncbi:hypothetical protein QE363_000352 [Sphingomonas sp. SORGH_AS870]|nr:hypothetical protein [Sphingomonas sp. SORGH_AS_0870]
MSSSRLRPQISAPPTPSASPIAADPQVTTAACPLNASAQRTRFATDRPITPPHPAGSASTAESETKDSAHAIIAVPITAWRSIRTQRPAGRSRHSRVATIGPTGRISATAGPNRVSAISAIHAPGSPIQLAGAAPDAVLSAGSLAR